MSKSRIFLFFAFAVYFSLSACAGSAKAFPDSSAPRNVDMTGYESVPMPAIPVSLTVPEDRAKYLLMHFWDALDFKDVSLPKDSLLLEQSFSNYIQILPLVSQDVRKDAVETMMRKANVAPAAYAFIAELADKYLWQPESPFRSEESFAPFADYYILNDPSRKELAVAMLEEIKMNAVGSVAPDFRMEDVGGKSHSLYDLLDRPLILMFYQPDCDHCLESFEQLKNDAGFMNQIAKGSYRLVPVYVGDEKEFWREQASTLPAGWNAMIDEPQVVDSEELYLIRSIPSFYVIDSDRRIRLKDASLPALIPYLANQ